MDAANGSTVETGNSANRAFFASCIKAIGRGKDGARALDEAQAERLFGEIYAGRIDDLSLGAVLIALRVKGESVEELAGAMRALAPHVARVPVDAARPVIVIPSYNGARKLPNLVPLLACLLADAGAQVIVHGILADPARTTTWQVMQAMGLACAASATDARDALARGDPAFVPIDALSPALAALLARRAVLGVRNTGHSLAKLLEPTGAPGALLLVSHTHAEFDELQHAYFVRTGGNALVMRGTEGEAVASPRRSVRIDWVHEGRSDIVLEPRALATDEQPALPAPHDVAETARWIQSVLAGERPVPVTIAAQLDAVLRAVQPQTTATSSTGDSVPATRFRPSAFAR